MDHDHHPASHDPAPSSGAAPTPAPSLNRLAAQATTHLPQPALGIAWVAAFPVNRWLLARGLGHAKAMAHHGDGDHR